MLILKTTWTVLKDLEKKKRLDKEFFYSSVKDGTTGDNGKKLDGHIRDTDYRWLSQSLFKKRCS